MGVGEGVEADLRARETFAPAAALILNTIDQIVAEDAEITEASGSDLSPYVSSGEYEPPRVERAKDVAILLQGLRAAREIWR